MLAVLFIGVIGGIVEHYRQLRLLASGREAFLAAQSLRFDKVVNTHSAPAMMVAWVILAALAAGVYELIAAGFTRLIPPSEIEE